MNQTQHINTGGGATIGNMQTDSGDAIGGNKIVNNISIQISTERDQINLEEEIMSVTPLQLDSNLLKQQLDAPGGAVRLRDAMYVERSADIELRQEMVRSGTTIIVESPRQTGRTSLLVRGIHHAKSVGTQAVFLDLQAWEKSVFSTPAYFLRVFAETICRELQLEVDNEMERRWQGSSSDHNELTYFLERVILPQCSMPLTLVVDQANRLFDRTHFFADFFELVQSWDTRRVTHSELWEKLNIILSISTESYLLNPNIRQFPFKIGQRLKLENFNTSQMQWLNQQHGSPVSEQNLEFLQLLLDGHPYLIRQALYELVRGQVDWQTLVNKATSEQGLFGYHLLHQYQLVQGQNDLIMGLRQVIKTGLCNEEGILDRLLNSGLIKKHKNGYKCRCELYQRYFEAKL